MGNFFLFIALVAWYYVIIFTIWLGSFLKSKKLAAQQPELSIEIPSLDDLNLDLVCISVLYIVFYYFVGL